MASVGEQADGVAGASVEQFAVAGGCAPTGQTVPGESYRHPQGVAATRVPATGKKGRRQERPRLERVVA